MTLEEVRQKYGQELVSFNSYYKYEFTFKGIAQDGRKLSISVGGDSSDIYRFDVDTSPVTVNSLIDMWPLQFEIDKQNESLYGWRSYD